MDGDLIEQLLDLPAELQQQALEGVGSSPEVVLQLVDELSRLH